MKCAIAKLRECASLWFLIAASFFTVKVTATAPQDPVSNTGHLLSGSQPAQGATRQRASSVFTREDAGGKTLADC
ncbi:hypothetical protein HOLleu_27020 [Holothuria leucospilota]|uniref:Secreted protein n=1 Tax=Holothuria leucospilota TaxID=206669 RepID=A0A9Q1BPT2_HOLLE|nr:hypothetical protein HOLleu_27020 [Holothuria leucospilota]